MSSKPKFRVIRDDDSRQPPAEEGSGISQPPQQEMVRDGLSELVRSTSSPRGLSEPDHEVLLALTLGEDVGAFTEEQRRLGAELASALDELGQPLSRRDHGESAALSPELLPLVELAQAVRAAAGGGELDDLAHERLLQRALAGSPRARRPRGAVFATVAAVAAGLALFWTTLSLVEDGTTTVSQPAGEVLRPAPPVELIRSRSTQTLFDPTVPFPPQGGESERLDTIARSRTAELRANRFAMWGVR